MSRLSIRHETLYTYDRPVGFAPHRLLIRPRDSHSLRVVSAELAFTPEGSTLWTFDAVGNSICHLTLAAQADRLEIVSQLVIERYPAPLEGMDHGPEASAAPVAYCTSDRILLQPYAAPVTEDPQGLVLDWTRAQLGAPDEPALGFLLRMTRRIHADFRYEARQEEGVQDPAQTIQGMSGTCRDFAWLMVETLRRVGYAARFVTGYLYSPRLNAVRGAGATHAWCQVFLPGLGWTEFDPTNGLAESADLIPVAVARTPREASPVSGAIIGGPARSELSVRVEVRPADDLETAA